MPSRLSVNPLYVFGRLSKIRRQSCHHTSAQGQDSRLNRNEVESLIQYAKDFFILQIRFAQKIAEVSHQALEDVVIDYTMLRNLFNLRVSHDFPNPLVDAFIEGLRMSDTPADWTYDFYLQRIGVASDASDEQRFFGCFSYVYPWANTHKLRLHFENRETSEHGALSTERMTVRQSELSAMFRHIRANHPDVETVRGGSWLYNIPAYFRLFPPNMSRQQNQWAMKPPSGHCGDSLLLARDPFDNRLPHSSWNVSINKKQ